MQVPVHFYSYFKDLAGCAQTVVTVDQGSTIEGLLLQLLPRFPQLMRLQNSMFIAVGVEYQGRDYILKSGDEVSLFPPVQGG